MIIPTKHISQDRALLTIGARILKDLRYPKTASALWEGFCDHSKKTRSLSYDSFVLALDLLFLMNAVELTEGILRRRTT